MNKKVIALVIVLLVLIGGGAGAILLQSNNSDTNQDNKQEISKTNSNNNQVINNNNNNEDNQEQDNNNNVDTENKKALVLYFSATGTTEGVAKKIQGVTDADIIEIKPKQEYTSADLNYNNDDCRANKEQNDKNARPEIANNIAIEDYDTIYLGYPIWWGTCPKIILTLLDNYNFDGKTVIPFCTSGGSGISQSLTDLKKYNGNVNWLEGRKFNSSVSNSDIEKWIKDLGL